MGRREAALKFVECFCAGDIVGLKPLLSANIKVKGPLYEFDSRQSYLDSLENDPPVPGNFRILNVIENKNDVSVVYEYQKSSGYLTITQLFRFYHQQINEMQLMFDTKGF